MKTPTRQSDAILVERSPSPRPSPPGRGRALRRVAEFRFSSLQSLLSFRFGSKTHHKWECVYSLKAAHVSPSPGGAGRGEGGRQSNLIHLAISTHPSASLRRRLRRQPYD
jgi:hypothetical protein